MVELSKLQQQQGEAAPQAVSFPVKSSDGEPHYMVLQAGPSHFGLNLRGSAKVTAPTVVISPIRGCSDPPSKDKITGKIAIMERGDCMFVDKTRRVQNNGAVGAIIIDNTPGSTVENSPLFSMSGDGTDDVRIPTVFLFSQDAAKLLLTLSKDPALEVTLSEWRNDILLQSNEEESVFQKLKVSVQEFLNKHTGIAFTKTVTIGDFKAEINTDKIRVTYEKSTEEFNPTEQDVNQQWSQIRRGLLKPIFVSKELFVPVNILRIYYQTLSGVPMDKIKDHDVLKQTVWLLTELSVERNRKDDEIIKEDGAKIERSKLEAFFLEAMAQIGKELNSDDLVIGASKGEKEKVILPPERLNKEKSDRDEL